MESKQEQNKEVQQNKELQPESTEELKDIKKKSKSETSTKKSRTKKKDDKEKEELKQKLEELNDKYLRLYSDFDNFRKRTIKEKIEMSKTASADVITTLLPVLDDCDRAKKSLDEIKDIEAVKEGMELISNKLFTILQQKGLEEMKSIGEVFNTDLHEAITNLPVESDDQKGKIIDEVEKGYYLNGKVIRFAKVVVGN